MVDKKVEHPSLSSETMHFNDLAEEELAETLVS